jgi:hypothetical protein
VNGEVIDKEFGDLYEFCWDFCRFDYCLFAYKIDDIIGEGQDNHIEARRSLEMVLFIVFLFLRKQGSEPKFLIISGDEFYDSH